MFEIRHFYVSIQLFAHVKSYCNINFKLYWYFSRNFNLNCADISYENWKFKVREINYLYWSLLNILDNLKICLKIYHYYQLLLFIIHPVRINTDRHCERLHWHMHRQLQIAEDIYLYLNQSTNNYNREQKSWVWHVVRNVSELQDANRR